MSLVVNALAPKLKIWQKKTQIYEMVDRIRWDNVAFLFTIS